MNHLYKTFKRMPDSSILFLVSRILRELKPVFDFTASVDLNYRVSYRSVKDSFDGLMLSTFRLRHDLPNLLYEESYGKAARLCCNEFNSLFYDASFFAAIMEYNCLSEEERQTTNIIRLTEKINNAYKKNVSNLCCRIEKAREWLRKRKIYFIKKKETIINGIDKELLDE